DLDLSNADLIEEVGGGLAILLANSGIDLPDSFGEMLPYIGELVLGIRLLLDIVAVERDFSEVPIDDRSRVHAVKALAILSRFGVSTVCTLLGGKFGGEIGGVAGSVFPGVGTVGGAAVGGLGGAAFGA